MKYLLDSNILIALGLDANDAVVARAAECDADDLVTSAIAFAEVLHGSERGKPPPLDKLAIMAEEIPVLPFDENAARAYAMISFKRASYDRLIAAHTVAWANCCNLQQCRLRRRAGVEGRELDGLSARSIFWRHRRLSKARAASCTT